MREIDIHEFRRFLFLKRGRSEGGIKTALSHLQAISGWFDENNKSLTQESVEEFFVQKKEKGCTNGTLLAYRTIFSLLEKFLNITLLDGIRLPESERKIPDILTTDEVKRLLAVLLPAGMFCGESSGHLSIVYQAITELLYFTGCRIEEALNLRKKQLIADSLVHFVKTKYARERMVFLYPPCHQKLIKLVEDGNPDTLVFRNMKNSKVHGVDYRKKLKQMAKIAGIKKRIHPHLMRHTLASHMAQLGTDLRVVQKILGHRNLNSTIYYEQFYMDRQVEAIYRLPIAQITLPAGDIIDREAKDIEKKGHQNNEKLEYKLSLTTRYGKKGMIFELFER